MLGAKVRLLGTYMFSYLGSVNINQLCKWTMNKSRHLQFRNILKSIKIEKTYLKKHYIHSKDIGHSFYFSWCRIGLRNVVKDKRMELSYDSGSTISKSLSVRQKLDTFYNRVLSVSRIKEATGWGCTFKVKKWTGALNTNSYL